MLSALLIAAAAGPTTALLHEFSIVSLGPTTSLWPVLAIVLAALLGIVLVLGIGHREFPRSRWFATIPNGAVLLLYGFFLLFFGLGGSR